MKTITTTIFGLIIFCQLSYGQKTMTLKDWAFLSDSNIIVLFAQNEFNTNYLIIPIESYFNAIENYLFKNDKRTELIDDLNIEFVYDEYIFNEGIGDTYLVFDESSIYTSYRADIRSGEKLCPYNCITEILFNESLRTKPEFVIIDDNYFSDIKKIAWNSNYEVGSGIDSAMVILEEGPKKVKMERKNKGSKKWLTYQLTFPFAIDYITNEPIGFETTVKIRKLRKMQCYNSMIAANNPEPNNYISQKSENVHTNE